VGCSKKKQSQQASRWPALCSRICPQGWQVLNSSELCRNKDLSSWFFERTNEACVNYDSTVCCIALSGFDKFQLVNFPKQLLARWLTPSASERGAVEAGRMILEIIRAMASEGYVLCMSTSIKDTTDTPPLRTSELQRTSSPDASFVLSLNRDARPLRLIEAPKSSAMSCCHHWTSGLTGDRDYHGSREFKLGGSPWWTEGAESVRTRLLITLLLQELRDKGWRLVQTIELCRRLNDKSVFVFARAQPESSLHWCLSLHSKSVLRFVNAQWKWWTPSVWSSLATTFTASRLREYSPAIIKFDCEADPGLVTNGNDHVHGRHMMLGILEAMQQRGWSLVCSADVSAIYHHADSGQDYPVDVHSLWFGAINKKPPMLTDGQWESEALPALLLLEKFARTQFRTQANG
uniref:Calpain catalytic domain-containing protein n=1 Tax=Macrostomum lignano TaxID=282301 RepID=A0A1I8FK64_9PLAT